MEYQKIINSLDTTTTTPSKFIKKNCVEINNESTGKYDSINTKFKSSMIRSVIIYVIIEMHTYLLVEI